MADNHSIDQFRVNLPYPGVEVVKKNREYARLIFSDYTGRAGELSAISQYSYQSFILETYDENAAKAVHSISVVEMHHLHLLGELIIKLGEDPKFIYPSRPNRYWNAGFVSYSKTYNKIILDDIDGEMTAIDNYQKHIAMIADEHVTALLQRIVLDEKLHLQIFHSLLKKA